MSDLPLEPDAAGRPEGKAPGSSDETDETVASLRWAAQLGDDEGMASVDWLAADIDPDRPTGTQLLVDAETPLPHLVAAKSAYKTLRIAGESPRERQLGARWYAAAIAAALVHHAKRISSQSDSALDRAFSSLVDDDSMPTPVRELVVRALFRLRSGTVGRD